MPRMMPRPPATVERMLVPGAAIEGYRVRSLVGPYDE